MIHVRTSPRLFLFWSAFVLAVAPAQAQKPSVDANTEEAAPTAVAKKIVFRNGVKQNVDYDFTVTTDKVDPFYHKGEKVTFTILLKHKGVPMNGASVKWALTKDGSGTALKEGTSVMQNGRAEVSGSLDEPGFLQCRADFKVTGEQIPTARSAGAIDVQESKPSLPAPDDFDAFWATQKKLLHDTPANVRLTPIKSPEAGVECFDIQADGPNGWNFSAYLARPIGAKQGTLPAIVCTQGAGVASSRLSLVAKWAKDGLLTLDFNAHGLPNGQPQKFYTDLYKGPLKGYMRKNPESRDTIWFRVFYLRLMRAIDIVTAQPEWDGRRLIVHGRSQGGGAALAGAGLDQRVTLICAQIPALCDETGAVVGRIAGGPKLVAIGADGRPEPKTLQAARYYDNLNFATHTQAEALITVDFIDISCPPTGIYAVYNAWKGKKEIVNFYHYGHYASPEGDAAVRDKVLSYIAKDPANT